MAEFETWRAQSPAHAIAFARGFAAWEQVDRAQQDVADLGLHEASEFRPSVMPSRRGLLRAAAGSALVIGAGGVLTSRAYAWSRAETGIGEIKRLHLPDGSAMMLNTDSAVAWRFSETAHVLRLERGEIALEVAPTPVMLSLRGAAADAQLSAGRFNARLQGDALDVMVIRGVAQSARRAASSGAVAARHQALLVTRGATRVEPTSQEQLAATIAWPSGEILFHDEPLSAALLEYNRYLPAKIVLSDPALGAVRVGGRFTSTDPSAFLEALQATLNLEVQSTPNGYLLSRKKLI
jgi:transmembrane sensor